MLLSIIIPVYNAETFLEECLSSVVNQNVDDCEIICVNDGSVDCSLKILQEFKKRDNRIIVIDQANSGVSAARNAGLEIARGEYVGFVDADDKISTDYFSIFLQNKGVDIISTKLNFGNIDSIYCNKVYYPEDIQQRIFPMMLANDELNSACAKVFKNEIIRKFKLRFPIGMTLGEDAYFVMDFLSHASSFCLIENIGYFYRENMTSASRSVKDDSFFTRAFHEFEFNHKQQFLLNIPSDKIEQLKAKRLINNFIANLSLFLRNNQYLSKKRRYQIVKENIKRLHTTNILQKYASDFKEEKGSFERFVLEALIQNSFIKIKWAYKYSHWRNKIK